MKAVKEQLDELPDGWAWTTLEDIGEVNPRFRGNTIDEDTEVTFLPMKCVSELTGNLDLSKSRPVSEVKKGYTNFAEGDLLFAKITPCMENGKVAVAYGLRNGLGFGSTEFHVIRFLDPIRPKLYFYYLIQDGVRKEARRSMTGSAGQLRVPTVYIRQLRVPLPPLDEQRRIVAKIEELFTKLDAGVESLKIVRAQLKRYRQAVFTSAMKGELSRKWRESYHGVTEPVSEDVMKRIHEKINKSRRGGPSNYPALDGKKLPPIPKSWKWVRIGDVLVIIDYRGRTPPYSSEGIPHLRSSNIRDGGIVWEDLRFVSEDTYDGYMTRGLPREGDLLFTTEAPLGEVASVPKRKFSLAQRVMILRPPSELLNSKFLLYQIRSGSFQGRLRLRSTGTTVKGISSRNFRPVELVIPSLIEQRIIVEETDRRLSVIGSSMDVVSTSLRRSKSLRRSIVTRAFSGNLVPQDPSDERASVLLRRIKRQGEGHEARNIEGTPSPSQAKIDAYQVR